jgi:hypothetical protein
MAALVWFTMGVALWHFTVPRPLPGGIVGALCRRAAAGAGDRAPADPREARRHDVATALYASRAGAPRRLYFGARERPGLLGPCARGSAGAEL